MTMASREGQTRIQAPMGLDGIDTRYVHTNTHTHLTQRHTHKKRTYIPKAESREIERDHPQSEDHNIKDRHKRGDDKNDVDVGKKE